MGSSWPRNCKQTQWWNCKERQPSGSVWLLTFRSDQNWTVRLCLLWTCPAKDPGKQEEAQASPPHAPHLQASVPCCFLPAFVFNRTLPRWSMLCPYCWFHAELLGGSSDMPEEAGVEPIPPSSAPPTYSCILKQLSKQGWGGDSHISRGACTHYCLQAFFNL